ncbi:CHASE4 domain-containing protein [Chloroflexota bacterium]
MELRNKTIIVIGLICFIGIATVILVSRHILSANFLHLEKDISLNNVQRGLNAIDKEIYNVATILWDWSAWDDTYAFIEDGNTDYIESNLIDGTFSNLMINLMLFIDSSGRVVFGKAFDLENEEEIPVTQSLQQHLSVDGPLLYHLNTESNVSGLISLDEGHMLIASRPILASNEEGPIRGTMIIGKYLDFTVLQQLEEITLIPLSTYKLTGAQQPPDVQVVLSSFTDESTVVAQSLNEDTFAGYAMLRDIYGEPTLVLKTEMSREIYKHSRTTTGWWSFSIVSIGIIVGFAMVWIIQRWIISPVSRLEADVRHITLRANPSTRVTVTGKDELGRLSSSVNNMLITIEETHKRDQELRGELEEEIRKRAEFTRALVHELKTPLTPMMASSGLLMEEIQDVNLLPLVRNIQKGTNILNKRIGELIDIAQGELGTMELIRKETDVLQLLHGVVDEMTPLALSRGQVFNSNLPSSLSLVWADEERLRQVLTNLLGNAFKFTSEGGNITIGAREKDDTLVVEVDDNGPGINRERRECVFDMYYSAEVDGHRNIGMGLGLTLSKMIIELHGGKIFVKSQPGRGSTFGFSLPLVSNKP